MSSNSKRIAKNSAVLYVRMLLSLAVSLYTSRVVLDVLGVDDYGIYSVVGGVVAMFAFINVSMSGATSRFLTYEMGRGNGSRLRDTFSTALLIHIGVAAIILVVAETVGLWILNCKLSIPAESMTAANWVYQCSIAASMISITQVPYNACIIAHENMNVYAYIEIANVMLKLGIVYLLLVVGGNKLIIYGILVLAVNIIIASLYRVYCLRKFPECRFRYIFDKNILKPMLSFSGWDLYGNMCVTARTQGIVMLINVFFGVAVNAAAAIATTVLTTLSSFASNIVIAFRPQIIKQYAAGESGEFNKLVTNCAKFSATLFLVLAAPVIAEADYVLTLWLKTPPPYSVSFCCICLAATFVMVMNNAIVTGIHATGKVKALSVISGTLYLLTLLPAWGLLRTGMTPQTVFYTMAVVNVLIYISNIVILKHEAPLFDVRSTTAMSIAMTLIFALATIAAMLPSAFMDSSFMRLILSTIFSTVLVGVLFWFCLLDKTSRALFINVIHNKMKK